MSQTRGVIFIREYTITYMQYFGGQMGKEVIFEKLKEEESILLLRAFDYDVDNEGYIISPS